MKKIILVLALTSCMLLQNSYIVNSEDAIIIDDVQDEVFMVDIIDSEEIDLDVGIFDNLEFRMCY